MPEASPASQIDLTTTPPRIVVPRDYNAACDLLDRNLGDGQRDRIAYIDRHGAHRFAHVADQSARAAAALAAAGVQPEQRVVLLMQDTAAFPAAFLGAMRMGAVPVPLNTLLKPEDHAYMLRDSRAVAAVVDAALWQQVASAFAGLPHLRTVFVDPGPAGGDVPAATTCWRAALAGADPSQPAAATTADDVALWLYSSGSTGAPKGVIHTHGDLIQTAALFGQGVLGLGPDDIVYSAAKLFFAYGLGNALTFPLSVGATTVLLDGRPTPDALRDLFVRHRPTVFCGVPTLYAGLLAAPEWADGAGCDRLRVCTSAGEALPRHVGEAWKARFGTDILDGLGSTEMLHIFLSNRPGAVRYGSTGRPVPGYAVRLVDDDGNPVARGEIGELTVAGPSAAAGSWNQREKSRRTFRGEWTFTGDKYVEDADGFFHFHGRGDDMLKVGGIWVSPFEVEAALAEHPDVLEAAVVGRADGDELVKPHAYVVPAPGVVPSPELAALLRDFVKTRLAPYKYPRWIAFVDDLPKTATGKIQRFRLRAGDGDAAR